MYLLDTCAVSDFIKGDVLTLGKIKSTAPSLLFLSSISYMEIMYGFARNPENIKKIKPIMQSFLDAIHITDFTTKDAKHAASIRAFLHQKGTPIGPFDLLIAAQAINHEFILITSNTREFQRIDGLKYENWRS